MKYIYSMMMFVLLLCACSNNEMEIRGLLNGMETYMEEYPQEALNILEHIDSNLLSTKKLDARYSLLYSMALDKNYIDITTDSIINKAVNYYSRHNDKDNLLKAYYYQARIYENANKYERAMESVARAEHIKGIGIDRQYHSKLQFLKERLYINLYDFKRAIDAAQSAAEHSLKIKDSLNYCAAVLDIANNYLLLNNYSKVDENLAIIKKHWLSLNSYFYQRYYGIDLLNSLYKQLPSSAISEILNLYLLLDTPDKDRNWGIVAQAYIYLKDYASASIALDKYETYANVQYNEAYHLNRSQIYEAKGAYKSALISYKEYVNVSDSIDLISITQDTKYTEERFKKQITIIKQKTVISVIIVLMVLISLILLIYIKKKIQQTKHLKLLINDLKHEYDELSAIQQSDIEAFAEIEQAMKALKEENIVLLNDKSAFENASKILDKRIMSLGIFLSKDLPDSLSKVAEEIEDLTRNRYTIVDNIGMLYAIYHPTFVERLAVKGLTASEIGYCCLLLLGLKTSEVGSVIYRSGTYNMSSGIRKKLELGEKDTRLSIWLKKLFEETKNDQAT